MFSIKTPDGERFLVQLVGARSYRIGDLRVTRGGTLTVTRRTRDYLVHKTKGQFVDYDPTPVEPIPEIYAPQFGMVPLAQFDPSDFDPKKNPPLSQSEAAVIAMQSATEGAVVDPLMVAGTMAHADAKAAQEAAGGDLTSNEIAKTAGPKAVKKSGVTLKGPVAAVTTPDTSAPDNATVVD